MSKSNSITISHFSDILCIWAYIAQIRVDELKREFSDAVELQYHFFSVFGEVDSLIDKNWSQKGGVAAYNKHIMSVVEKFEHIEVHPEIWLASQPKSSLSCHLYFKAVQLLEVEQQLHAKSDEHGRSCFESFVWRVREAFFKNAENIAEKSVLLRLCEEHHLPIAKIEAKIDSGEAFAALDADLQLAKKFYINGSPTLVFNEGRQTIYGNVGYRVIEANIRELLHQPEGQYSWC